MMSCNTRAKPKKQMKSCSKVRQAFEKGLQQFQIMLCMLRLASEGAAKTGKLLRKVAVVAPLMLCMLQLACEDR